jgi:hypothetical protein
MTLTKKDIRGKGFSSGSALILVVVLTSLLSILAVMFMLSSRVDKITASAISGNKELDFGVDSVVAKISQQLAADVPNGDPNIAYYDYPDDKNRWLANLEPYMAGGNYYWQHISDIYNKLGLSQDVVSRQALIKKDYQDTIEVGDSSVYTGVYYLADADGDGVADSVWVELPDVNSSKGKPVYAAVRVIDNSAMLNVNTAYLFDPNEIVSSRVDGSRQTQINLTALSQRGANIQAATKLQTVRCGSATPDIAGYENQVVWNYGQQFGAYTPFDISDELKLRNRYLLTSKKRETRIEFLWTNAYYGGPETPIPTSSYNRDRWFKCAYLNTVDPLASADYDYRHISTTYNMDRLIAPDGMPMTNANGVADANVLYGRLLRCIDPGVSNAVFDSYSAQLAQIAANIKDYGDSDADVSIVYDWSGKAHSGFERPCIFISELVYKLAKVDITPPGGPVGAPPVYQTNWSYGIELSKLYPGTNGDNWRLMIDSREIDINNLNPPDFAKDGRRYLVIIFEDPCVPLASTVLFSDSPEDGETGVSPNVILGWPVSFMPGVTSYDIYFGTSQNDVNESATPVQQGPSTFYDPLGPLPLDTSKTYYWRIDDLDGSGNVIAQGDVWNFTTLATEPNVIFEYINKSDIFHAGSLITLEREVKDNNNIGHWLTVDSVSVPADLVADPCGVYTGVRSFQRDMSEARWIKRLWSNDVNVPATLGYHNDFNNPGAGSMRARPGLFNNVGDLAMVFSKSTYYDTSAGQISADAVGYSGETEDQVRIDLRDPNFQRIFQYVSAFAEAFAHPDSQGRIKAKGRININTAPWYVIAQLPWVAQRRDIPSNYDANALAQAIVAYRDKLDLGGVSGLPNYLTGRQLETGLPYLREEPGFNSIAELAMVVDKNINAITDIPMNYYDMRYYVLGGRGNNPQMGFPDLTFNGRTGHDDAPGDMEKRYLIFSRISDLVTVRSDVFTAYILIRVGNNGPQKRVIAILDRSDVAAGGKVKVIAVHPVPDPR